jgi:hypothetical protein
MSSVATPPTPSRPDEPQPPGASPTTTGSPAPRGGRTPQQWAFMAVLGIALVLAVSTNIRSGETDPMVGESIAEARLDQLQAEDAVADREAIAALIEELRVVQGELYPVLQDLGLFLPAGEPAPRSVRVPGTMLASWTQTTADAVDAVAASTTGRRGTNDARESFESAADVLDDAVRSVAAAMEVEGDERAELLQHASEQRDLGVQVWSIGATQLDRLSILAGFGHQHVFLEIEGTGALTPDGVAGVTSGNGS